MSVIPVSSLSSSDLAELGNNVRPPASRGRIDEAAVNQSLTAQAERVATLFNHHRQRIARRRRRTINVATAARA